MRKIIQTVTFKATPHEVFELLMDSKKHSGFTGDKAIISREAGGKFSAYDGYITGENLEIVKDKKIVQRWRASDWPEGTESKVTFSFEETSGGTKMKFTHEGVPDEFYDDIKQGWIDFYWTPMKEYLADR